MKQILVGYRPYSFEDRASKQLVEGVTLFTYYPAEGVKGYQTTRLSVKSIPSNIDDMLGAEIAVEYGEKGRVLQIIWPKPETLAAAKK